MKPLDLLTRKEVEIKNNFISVIPEEVFLIAGVERPHPMVEPKTEVVKKISALVTLKKIIHKESETDMNILFYKNSPVALNGENQGECVFSEDALFINEAIEGAIEAGVEITTL